MPQHCQVARPLGTSPKREDSVSLGAPIPEEGEASSFCVCNCSAVAHSAALALAGGGSRAAENYALCPPSLGARVCTRFSTRGSKFPCIATAPSPLSPRSLWSSAEKNKGARQTWHTRNMTKGAREVACLPCVYTYAGEKYPFVKIPLKQAP